MKNIYIIVILVSVVAVSGGLQAGKLGDKHKNKVIKQHKLDIKNRDTILQELNAFLKESSDEISEGNVKLGIPVEENAITEVKDTDGFHYTGVIPPKIYGYVNTGSLNMRSEDSSGSEIVGKVKFKERVEIIFQSDKTDTFKNVKAATNIFSLQH